MRHLIRFCIPYWHIFLIIILLTAAQVFCDLALPAYLAVIVDKGVALGDNNLIKNMGIIMLVIALGSIFASILIALTSSILSAKLAKDLRESIFKSVSFFEHKSFDSFSTATLITRTTNDIQQVQFIVEMLPKIILYAPVIAIGGIIRVLQTGSKLGWIIGMGVAVLATCITLIFLKVIPNFKKLQELIDNLNLRARQTLTGLPIIRAFNTQHYEEGRFNKTSRDISSLNMKISRIMIAMRPMITIILNIMTILIIWYGASFVEKGELAVGEIIALLTYATQIVTAFLMFSMISFMLPRASVSSNRIFEVINTGGKNSYEFVSKEAKKDLLDKINKGKISFKNVTFMYEGAETPVIKDVSFTVPDGKLTAVIGGTGSGKSTLVKLMLRFYDPTNGEITLDGIDTRDIPLSTLREFISYSPQKSSLLSGTVESNLKYGNEDVSENKMMKVIEIAQATDFIDIKTGGLEEKVSQKGANFSGGQKQRLSIARALVKDSHVYIFDDSFTALDFETDSKLRAALAENLPDTTKIVVTQRISTTMHADHVIVMDEGCVVGEGVHKELLKTCPVYREIALSQLPSEAVYE